MKSIMRTLVVITCLATTTTSPVITFLSKHISPTGKHVYVLGDFHGTYAGDAVGKKQMEAVIAFAQKLAQPWFVGEDIAGYAGNDKNVKKGIKKLQSTVRNVRPDWQLNILFKNKKLGWQSMSFEHAMIGSVALFKGNNIPGTSVEFRYTKDASSYGAPIVCSEILASLDTIAKEALNYRDGEKVQAIYEAAVKQYYSDEARQALENPKVQKLTLPAAFPPEKGFNLSMLGAVLMVPRILHEIYTHKDNNIIILVGGKHAEEIANILPMLGYKSDKTMASEINEGSNPFSGMVYIALKLLDLESFFEQELKECSDKKESKVCAKDETVANIPATQHSNSSSSAASESAGATTAASSSSTSSTSVNSVSSTTKIEPQNA